MQVGHDDGRPHIISHAVGSDILLPNNREPFKSAT